MIETLEDVVEDLANQVGVYGAHRDGERYPCRCCWTSFITDRIRQAVEVERKLQEK